MRFLLFLLLLPAVTANPIFTDGYITLKDIPQLHVGDIRGSIDLTVNKQPLLDATVTVVLVKTDQENMQQYATAQEWIVAETTITGITAATGEATVPFTLTVPAFAPSGTYRLEFYARNGRRYMSGYLPAMFTSAVVMRELKRSNEPTPVPIINVLETKAEQLPGARGPFVNKETVQLTVVLTEPLPVDVRITRCTWDDTSGEQCFNNTYHSARSPLVAMLPLPYSGSYGIRVEALHKGIVTSTSRLRAVRNGTSPRIAELTEEDGMIRSILMPSADNFPDPTFDYVVTVNGAIVDTQQILFAVPGSRQENVDRSLSLTHDGVLPAAYTLEGTLSLAGKIVERYTRHVDHCATIHLCCQEGVPRSFVT